MRVSIPTPLTLASTQTVRPYACLYNHIELFIDSAIVIRDVGVDSRSGVRSRLGLGLGHFAAGSGTGEYLNVQLNRFRSSRTFGLLVGCHFDAPVDVAPRGKGIPYV